MTDIQLAPLIARVLSGDLNAFEEIVVQYQMPVRAFLAARLSDQHEAEDLAQEVFMTAFARLAEFDSSLPLTPWLRGIANNQLRNHLRRRREKTAGDAAALDGVLDRTIDGMDEDAGHAHELTALQTCLQAIDRRARELLELRYARGCELAEIEAQLQLKHSAVSMALHRVRQRLRDCIHRRLNATEAAPQ